MPIYGNQWYKDEAEYKRSRSSSALRTTTGSVPEVDGIRRGFNGRAGRLSSAAHTGDMVVYRPNGDRYIVSGTRRRKRAATGIKRLTTADIDRLNKIDAATRRIIRADDNRFGYIGNVD